MGTQIDVNDGTNMHSINQEKERRKIKPISRNAGFEGNQRNMKGMGREKGTKGLVKSPLRHRMQQDLKEREREECSNYQFQHIIRFRCEHPENCHVDDRTVHSPFGGF